MLTSYNPSRKATFLRSYLKHPKLQLSNLFQQRALKRFLLSLTVLAMFVVLNSATAMAGTGTFRDGKFNFCVSIRFEPTPAELQRIQEVFQLASTVLADATDGQHQFGTISLVTGSAASDQAEFWIMPPPGKRANATLGGYGLRGRHITLYYGAEFAQPDTMRNALIVTHEFAHHAYAVDDEYMSGQVTGPNGLITDVPAHCPGTDRESPTLNYCLMDNIWGGTRRLTLNYSVNEFCVDSNHDKPLANGTEANDTAQSRTNHGDACWETMTKLNRKWRLTAPSNLPQDAPPPPPTPVVFNTSCAGQSQRVVLLFDRSGSMETQNRLIFAKAGAAGFIDNYGIGDFIGVVSFGTTASVNLPLTEISVASRTTVKNAVNSLATGGVTNLGDGLTLAASLLSSSCTDCQKTIILMSDGDSNAGAAPESLIPTLQNADIKVISATVGSDISVAGESTLKAISNQTGGGYSRAATPEGFMHFLVDLAFGTSGLRLVGNAPQFLGPNQTKEVSVLVEPDSQSITFGITVSASDNITLALRNPSGTLITESGAPPGQFTASSGLRIFKIPTPDAGTWKMVITSTTVTSGNVQTFTYTQHPGTDLWATILDDNVFRSEPIIVTATPTHDGRNVTKATVTGNVVHPNGSQSAITLFDDGSEAHGDVRAGDGVYSAIFSSYSDVGTYTFNLKYENTSGETYTGESMPEENGQVPIYTPIPVPPVSRLTSITAIVSGTNDADRIWFDDVLPEGAVPNGINETFAWVNANPGAYSGQLAHQSQNFSRLSPPANTFHGHYFEGAGTKLPVSSGQSLFTWVFLDVNNMPREIMLEFKDASGWEHRAYWGENLINRGTDGTASRHYVGVLPAAGLWQRLEVSAAEIGLEGSNVEGMSFLLDGGKAAWDLVGTRTATPPPFVPQGDSIWIDGALPPGAVAGVTNDVWNWVPCSSSGSVALQCHQSILPPHGPGQVRHHQYTGGPPQLVNPGDTLFTYVFIDDVIAPDQLFLQWHDGTNWRRAYWGRNWRELGIVNTENWRYMGGIPQRINLDNWTRLEIPASYLGLEGKYVTGMSFGFFRQDDNAQVIWGRSGKTTFLRTSPLTLTSLTPVWRYFHNQFGYYYSTKDVPLHDNDQQQGTRFYVHSNQAPGTVPMYRFVNTNPNKREFFYSQCQNCYASGGVWRLDGIAFYVYPNGSTLGTVPLHLYHTGNKYFMTTLQGELPGWVYDGVWGWVHETDESVPSRPTNLVRSSTGCMLSWMDNSTNETGFEIQKRVGQQWTTLTTVGPNVNSLDDCNLVTGSPTSTNYIVYAFNTIGKSFASNPILAGYRKPCKGCVHIAGDAIGEPAVSDDPTVSIASPRAGAVVGRTFSIVGNAFDADGNGSISRVEFYDSSQKIGEVFNAPPYNFLWANASLGSHTLTAKVFDSSGKFGVSDPIQITVSDVPLITVTSPADGAVVTAPGNVSIQASASDADGSIAKVEFYEGATKLGEDTTAPYSFSWNNVPAGVYDLTARAIDNLGLSVGSELVSVTVNVPPSVTLTAPNEGLVLQAPAEVILSASAADVDGTVNKVEFFHGSTLIATKTVEPFTHNWTNIPYGSYALTAKVTDDKGAFTTSTVVNLVVNSAPAVSITLPNPSTMFHALATMTIAASASDVDGSITSVDFFQGSTLLGTDNSAPFSFTWGDVAAGTYALTARATDNRNASTTSATVNIVVNSPPTVSLTLPSPNAVFNAPAFITLAASASDSDGTISSVEFFQGSTSLGIDNASPYSVSWPDVAIGTYTLTAKATDNRGRITTSVPISITVRSPYSYRRSITIDHAKVPNTDQSNFPVLIKGTYAYLATVANGGSVQNANGYDVIFTADPSCMTKLAHEVETYSASTGTVNYWVKVPSLSHSTDTVIYMCYGNNTVTTDQSNKTAVWDANYKAVYHLKDGTTLNVTDATSSHDLTNNGATATSGQVDGAGSFDGSTQYLSIAEHSDFTWSNLRTIEFWVKLGSTTQTLPRLFSHSDGGSDGWSITWIDPPSAAPNSWTGNFLVVSLGTQAVPSIQKQTPDNGPLNSTSAWHHVVVVGDGTTVSNIYLNGSPVSVTSLPNPGNITNTTTSGLNIGRRNNNGRYFNGVLDEIRFSNSQRSADWIKTGYNNQNSPSTFYTISAQESVARNIFWPVPNYFGTPSSFLGQTGWLASLVKAPTAWRQVERNNSSPAI